MFSCFLIECNQSKGENKVSEILEKLKIKNIKQYIFDDCRNKQVLPFDFYLPDLNMCIEYDGMQHFKSIEYFGGEKKFLYTKENDKIKNEYCKNNNIILLRIPYTKFKEIENILTIKIKINKNG